MCFIDEDDAALADQGVAGVAFPFHRHQEGVVIEAHVTGIGDDSRDCFRKI